MIKFLKSENFYYRFKNGYSLDMASYSDDTARYIYKENKSSVIERLEKTLKLEFHWFSITISLLGFVSDFY